MSIVNRKSSLGPAPNVESYFTRGQRRDDVETATKTQLVAGIRARRVIKTPVPVLIPPPGRMGGDRQAALVTTLYVVSGYVDPDYVE